MVAYISLKIAFRFKVILADSSKALGSTTFDNKLVPKTKIVLNTVL